MDEELDDEELRATRILNGVISGDKVYTQAEMDSVTKSFQKTLDKYYLDKFEIKFLLNEVTEEYHKECQYNTISNRCFELKGAKEILEKILKESEV